jgi:hypothetical protein
MSNKTSKFKPGDIVRVLNGVRDPDFHTNIGGWSGKVEEVDLIEPKYCKKVAIET